MTTSAAAATPIAVGGPHFDDLAVGDRFDAAPSLTLTDGHAALHQAIVGDRLRLPLDATLSRAVTGEPATLVHPALVCDVAIGQSTLVTQRVIANLFYRGLVLRRAPVVGDTLRTSTEVVALRRNRDRPGREPTGLAVLRVRTTDQHDRTVLDFWRCAMLPVRDPATVAPRDDDLDAVPSDLPPTGQLAAAVAGWNLGAFRAGVPAWSPTRGTRWVVEGGDSVTAAPELARMTLNIATVHHDPFATPSSRRLVYGGHTIGIAASQLSRALPDLVYIVAWRECSHLGPVHEGDVLSSAIELESVEPLPAGGALAEVRCELTARRPGAEPADPAPVLDWRLVGVLA